MELITTHIGADFDSLASMVAASKLYPNALIAFPGSMEQNVREFLTLHKYAIQIRKPKDIPIEKVKRLILVDTRLASRIGPFAKILERERVSIHIYDHHPPTAEDLHGELNVVNITGAASAILTHIIKKRKIHLSKLEATILLIGIYEDTGSFTYGSTTPLDMEAAAYLLKMGANLNLASDFINPGLTPEQLKLLNIFISNLRIVNFNGVRIALACAKLQSLSGSLSLVVHKLRDMENLSVIFVAVQTEKRIHIVARSRLKEVDVGKILELLGGGGHSRAAAAVIHDQELETVEKKLTKILKNKIKPLVLAKNIMIAPVKTVQEGLQVNEACKMMLRFNFSGLPVLRGDKIVGIVSRTDLDRASQHGLMTDPVKNYMSSPPITIAPDSSVEDIQKLMIENDLGHLPVVDGKGFLRGMVTRGELLRVLHDDGVKDFSLYSLPLVKNNMRPMIGKRLPVLPYKLLKKIGRIGKMLRYPTFVVGGFVRDTLMNIENLDIDVVVEGDGIKFGRVLAKRLNGDIVAHEAFGTSVVTVKKFPFSWKARINDPLKIDVATARTEFYEYPAALPKVEHSSIRQDLYRRDFTINAMAVRLDGKHFGELYDFFGGKKDLSAKSVRVLHNLSFVDDPTRIFRAIRLAARYNFKIDSQTVTFIKNALDLALFDKLTNERIREELIAIFDEAEPLKAIMLMDKYGILSCMHPSLKIGKSIKGLFLSISDALSWAILYNKDAVKKWLIYFMALLKNLNEKELSDVVAKFKFSQAVGGEILQLPRLKAVTRKLNRKGIKPSIVHKAFKGFSTESLLFMMASHRGSYLEKYIGFYITKLSSVRLKIDGGRLKEMGFEPGPKFKIMINSVLDAKLDGDIKDTLESEEKYIMNKWGLSIKNVKCKIKN